MADSEMYTFIDELLGSNCITCTMCNEILKPPVMLVENIGNICSSCYEETEEPTQKSLNNQALAKILGLLKLPCKFKSKGCNERMLQQDLLDHQNECKFHTKICAMFYIMGCDWEGNLTDFKIHFKECHGDHIINFENNLFFLEISLKDLNVVKLLLTKKFAFILRMKTDLNKEKLHYMICSAADEYHPYEYTVKHKGSSENYIKTKSKVLPCANMCNEFEEKYAVEVDLDALKQISRVADTIVNVFKIKIDDAQVDGIDDKMLHFFECPVCKMFMKPPIFQCQSGHSICNLCRPRLEKCPTCRAIFGSARNYSLEGLTSGVHYPCVYHDLGCNENGAASQILKHEKECIFRPFNCPFSNCSLTGNRITITTHLINFHSDSVLSSGSTAYSDSFRLDPNSSYTKIYDRKCIIAYNHIFRVCCKRIAEYCLWAVEVFGTNRDSKTFIYEVAIIDTRRPEKKLIKTDYCLSDVSEEELFKRCVMFPGSALSSYSNCGMVTFFVTIKEK